MGAYRRFCLYRWAEWIKLYRSFTTKEAQERAALSVNHWRHSALVELGILE